MTAERWSTSDHDDLMHLIDADPIHADDSTRIKAAIIADGKAHGGRICANRVRAALTNSGGHLDVWHKCVGPAYVSLRTAGLIKGLGYIDVNRDKSGNDGKPAMGYALTDAGWVA